MTHLQLTNYEKNEIKKQIGNEMKYLRDTLDDAVKYFDNHYSGEQEIDEDVECCTYETEGNNYQSSIGLLLYIYNPEVDWGWGGAELYWTMSECYRDSFIQRLKNEVSEALFLKISAWLDKHQ